MDSTSHNPGKFSPSSGTHDPPNALELSGHHLFVLTHQESQILMLSKMGEDDIPDEKKMQSLVIAYSEFSKDINVVQQSKQSKGMECLQIEKKCLFEMKG